MTQNGATVPSPRERRNRVEQARYTLYYPRLRIAYTYIPKNACSTLKGTLAAAEDNRGYDVVPHELDGAYRTRPEDFGPDWSRVLVLRDPFDRLVSAYLDKIVRMRAPSHYALVAEIYRDTGRAPPQGAESVSLTEFFDWITRQEPEWLDAHWRPQHYMVTLDRYDHVLPFDRLERHWKRAGLARRAPLLTYDTHATRPLSGRRWWGATPALTGRDLLDLPGHHIRGHFETCGHFPDRSCFARADFMDRVREFYRLDYALLDSYGLSTR